MEDSALAVWRVVSGPYEVDDMPYEERPDDPDFQSYLVLSVSDEEVPEVLFNVEVWFDSFEGAYKYKKYVDESMVPVPIGVFNND